jgi:hypothetical protein
MARRNQVSCLPAGASGAARETNRDGEPAVAAGTGPVLPGDPVHPAAAPASTTPRHAYQIGLTAFAQASRLALPCGKPPAGATRRLRSQIQFVCSRPLPVGLVRPL